MATLIVDIFIYPQKILQTTMFLGSCIVTKSTHFTKPKLSLQSLYYIPDYLTISHSNPFDISCPFILIWLFCDLS